MQCPLKDSSGVSADYRLLEANRDPDHGDRECEQVRHPVGNSGT